MVYKLNRYLYISPKKDVVVIYNLLSDVIFAITREKYLSLIDDNLSELKEKKTTFFSAMEKLGVILPADVNEIDQIKMRNRQAVFSNQEYRLTINPTLECNFNCWYCYETHQKGKMQQNTMEAIVNHIKLKINDKSLRRLNLDWFGGEPLLYFDEILYPLSKQIKDILDEKGIPFVNSATTNGYLIDEERIEKFKEISLSHFQITLDGSPEMHNKIRFDKNKEGSFKTIIGNINLLADNPENNVAVRINYTKQTLLNVNEIIHQFSDRAKNNIVVLFQQVWQDSLKQNISAENNKKEFEKHGIRVRNHELNKKYYVCYADLEHQVVINHDGKIYKCTARDFNDENFCGELLPSGEIQWNTSAMAKRMGHSTFENEFCLKCNLLPVCMGLCSQKMVELPPTYDEKLFRRMCLQGGVKEIIEQNIENYYNKLTQKN
ncbi:MAG: radical SAM protein [Cytophagaceae bacterium]|jgi:uncharacterized protein|nr:radical SAM protein [Cytophagaceae bacterium]